MKPLELLDLECNIILAKLAVHHWKLHYMLVEEDTNTSTTTVHDENKGDKENYCRMKRTKAHSNI